MAVPGNPYDGHTLAKQLEQTARITGVTAQRSYVDQGYKGHDAPDKEKVFITRQKHGLTPTIKRELKRRSAVRFGIMPKSSVWAPGSSDASIRLQLGLWLVTF